MTIKVNQIYLGDCVEILKSIDDNSVNLVVADPPFNINLKKYDIYKDNLPSHDYLLWCDRWISECKRILKDDGSIYIVIGDEFFAEIALILKKYFHWRNYICWYFTFGQAQKKKFSRCHTQILYFTKSPDNFCFNVDAIRVPSARQIKYKDKRANVLGKLPDDVWQISRVCGTFGERLSNHPCQMPEEVLERIIKASSSPGNLILDPFCGTGTTVAVADRLGRNYISMDISETYVEVARRRLEAQKNKDIYSDSLNDGSIKIKL